MNLSIQKTISSNRGFSSKGFSLIEVLIAMVILSIGLLGLAGLQVAGMKNNHNAYQRSQANVMAYDIADRMRANMVAVAAGAYNDGTAAANPNCLTTTKCTPAEMAGHDLSEWNAALAAQLPEGEGVVCLDDDADTDAGEAPSLGDPDCGTVVGGGNVYAVKIWWQERANTGTGTPELQRFTMSFQP